jgi:hypothetical protein
VINAPNIPVIHTNFLKTITVIETLVKSSFEFDVAIFLTALLSKPKFVRPTIKDIVELNNPTIPKPAGPISIAINFVLIIEIIILKIWTPPNKEVDLKILL